MTHFRFEDLQKILIELGYTKQQGAGSHTGFKKPGFNALPIPIKRLFVKPYIVKIVLDILDETEDITDT